MAVACIGVVFVGFIMQFLGKLRNSRKWSAHVSIVLFGAHITLSYLLMLVAMSYNVELFCMVCLGLTIGYATFHTALLGDIAQRVNSYRVHEQETGDLCCSALNESPLMDDSSRCVYL